MTKADLIEKVAETTGLTKKDSGKVIESVIENIKQSLRHGERVEIRGLGSFGIRERKPRLGRNPQTGQEVQVPAKKIPFFRVGKELKDLVNQPPAPEEKKEVPFQQGPGGD